MIDLSKETHFPLAQAAKDRRLAGPKGRPAVSTVWRWATSGAGPNRVRLETVRTPRGLATSTEAITRFLAALNGQDARPAPSKWSKRQADAAEAHLDALGVK